MNDTTRMEGSGPKFDGGKTTRSIAPIFRFECFDLKARFPLFAGTSTVIMLHG